MKPFLRKIKITEVYFEPIGKDAKMFFVWVKTDHDEKANDYALDGTMCVGFLLKLLAEALKHKAKIYRSHTSRPRRISKRIRKPSISKFKAELTYQ